MIRRNTQKNGLTFTKKNQGIKESLELATRIKKLLGTIFTVFWSFFVKKGYLNPFLYSD